MTDRIEQLRRMLEEEPDDAFCLYALAQEFAKQGQHETAVAHFNRVLEADPNYAYASFHKARVLAEMGDSDSAIASLEDGLQRAEAAEDAHAFEEISAYLDELRELARR